MNKAWKPSTSYLKDGWSSSGVPRSGYSAGARAGADGMTGALRLRGVLARIPRERNSRETPWAHCPRGLPIRAKMVNRLVRLLLRLNAHRDLGGHKRFDVDALWNKGKNQEPAQEKYNGNNIQ